MSLLITKFDGDDLINYLDLDDLVGFIVHTFVSSYIFHQRFSNVEEEQVALLYKSINKHVLLPFFYKYGG